MAFRTTRTHHHGRRRLAGARRRRSRRFHEKIPAPRGHSDRYASAHHADRTLQPPVETRPHQADPRGLRRDARPGAPRRGCGLRPRLVHRAPLLQLLPEPFAIQQFVHVTDRREEAREAAEQMRFIRRVVAAMRGGYVRLDGAWLREQPAQGEPSLEEIMSTTYIGSAGGGGGADDRTDGSVAPHAPELLHGNRWPVGQPCDAYHRTFSRRRCCRRWPDTSAGWTELEPEPRKWRSRRRSASCSLRPEKTTARRGGPHTRHPCDGLHHASRQRGDRCRRRRHCRSVQRSVSRPGRTGGRRPGAGRVLGRGLGRQRRHALPAGQASGGPRAHAVVARVVGWPGRRSRARFRIRASRWAARGAVGARVRHAERFGLPATGDEASMSSFFRAMRFAPLRPGSVRRYARLPHAPGTDSRFRCAAAPA